MTYHHSITRRINLRFRREKVVFMADWEKIFYSIFSNLSTSKIPRFCWHKNNTLNKRLIADFRNSLSHDIASYRMAVNEVEHTYRADVT